jgi:hypothetical protein
MDYLLLLPVAFLSFILGFYACLAFLSTILKKVEVKIADKKATVHELNPNKWD